MSIFIKFTSLRLALFVLSVTATAIVTANDQTTQPSPAAAPAVARVDIQWQDPQSFSDVRAANQSRARYREQTFAQIEQHLDKLVSTLPQGQTLQLTVTDLNLAGRVWPSSLVGLASAGDVRIIKGTDFPAMRFSYTLRDDNSDIVKAGEEHLRDLSFQNRVNRHSRGDALRYEKRMLDDWFAKTFAD